MLLSGKNQERRTTAARLRNDLVESAGAREEGNKVGIRKEGALTSTVPGRTGGSLVGNPRSVHVAEQC